MTDTTICYSPKPQVKYTVGKKVKWMKGLNLGIGDPEFVDSPELWNYNCITSRLPFIWESATVKLKDKPSRFPNLERAKKDLRAEIGGVAVKAMMSMSPTLFLGVVEENSVSHLEVCKWFGSESSFRSVVKARTLVWQEANGQKLTDDERAFVKMISFNA